MSRTEPITLYVTEQRKQEIEDRAEREDTTVSSYLNHLIERQLRVEAEDELSAESRATEELQRVIDEGTRQLRDATEDLRELNAKTGVYTIANFELLKQNQKQPAIKDALSTGSLRLREDLDLDTEVDPEAESEPPSDDDDSNGGDTGGSLVEELRGS
ncbi:hypothetical protein [Saliphagus infecundisoli]|uniref:Uncharacterized protein n=1 Tax=Saliphagus infecundisoli TaxID=1849069 RepID=A0ABD5QLV4_9EURY|nr:hypothetical protein [Saliphagus infecundisoli]